MNRSSVVHYGCGYRHSRRYPHPFHETSGFMVPPSASSLAFRRKRRLAQEEDVASLVEHLISLKSANAQIGVSFNPVFISEVLDAIPQLITNGFLLANTETNSSEGTYVSGRIRSPEGDILDLGTVLLTDIGGVQPIGGLVPVSRLIRFISRYK